jgi:tRNA (guanine37-N1)-methyltransferase
MTVPAPLTNGNHAEIERWRKDQALERTRARRPDLLAKKRQDP